MHRRIATFVDEMRPPEAVCGTLSAERAESDGLFISIDGDFPAFGRAYSSISPEEWSIATSIAMERHKALNWLCGFAPGNRWDETPTDT